MRVYIDAYGHLCMSSTAWYAQSSCYSAGIVTNDRWIGSWSPSYDLDLQHQRCKKLQRN
jgi:dTDP-D-glucose 4,6-dehydratase